MLIIDIKVVPSSGRQTFKLDKSGKIKCFLKNPPEKGKANKELISLFSKKLGLSKDDVSILLGETSRNKRISINLNITVEELYNKLEIERQMSIK